MKLFRNLLVAVLALVAGPTLADQSSIVQPTTGPHSAADLATNYLNPALRALLSNSSGSSAPANGPSGAPMQWQTWLDTSTTPATWRMYDGSSWVAIGTVDTSLHLFSTPFTQAGTGSVARSVSAKLQEAVSILDFATCDGSTVETTKIQQASDAAQSQGKALFFNNTNACVTGQITLNTGATWVGPGGNASLAKIKLAPGSTTGIIKAGDSGALTQANNVTINGISFDGNHANTPGADSDLINIFGGRPHLENVDIHDATGNGLVTGYNVATAGDPLLNLGYFKRLNFDTIQKSCWINNGPNDSAGDSILGTDCGLAGDNLYYGFLFQTNGNGRWNDIHFNNRDVTTNTPNAGVLVNTSGNTFTNSHFEGGHTPLVINAPANRIDGAYYAPRGPEAVAVLAGYNVITGVAGLGGATGHLDYTCISLNSPNNIVDITSINCNTGTVQFNTGDANNIVRVRGGDFTSGAVGYTGTPDPTDKVDLKLDGIVGATSKLFRDPNVGNAWATWTPTVTYPGTAPTTASVAYSKWTQIGAKSRALKIKLLVSTPGPAAGNVQFTLPNSETLADDVICSAGTTGGVMLFAEMATSINQLILVPSWATATYVLTCTYEVN